MTGVNAIRSKYTRHSLKLSEVEIDMKLKEYFADHDVLIRSDFQALCGMARTTANVHLKRLQQEGKLKNVGKPRNPIYRAMRDTTACRAMQRRGDEGGKRFHRESQ